MNEITDEISNVGLIPGRMISHSKSRYLDKHPDNEVYFNANIFTLNEGKIWYGDLDLTLDEKFLNQAAKSIGKSLYVLKEYDGRFDNESLTDAQIISNSVKVYHP
jgi:hypothetical protein